ncbi:MAG: phosphotransferase [bacterium]|nr:phosphotransferase [bacterium]
MVLERVIAVRNSKTVYRDGANCIKVFDEGYSKADVLNEALNQAKVEKIGICIPEIKEVCKIDGKWAIVSEYIKGNTIERLMELEPEKKDEYLEQFVSLHMDILSKTCPNLNRLKDKMNAQITLADIDATARYDLHARVDGMPRGANVCHGDFIPSNVIVAEDGRPFVIDWAHVTQGNPLADVARTYLLFWLGGNINGASQYLDLYCMKSGVSKQDVQNWMPVVAAAQSTKGNEKEREFLLSWVNVFEYN